MDTSSTPKETATPSLHSSLSTTTLGKADSDTTTLNQPDSNTTTTATAPQTSEPKQPSRYLYYEKTGRPPNPDAQLKPKSKLDKLLSKFQSPAVQKTNAARERELLEEERRGVKISSATGVAMGSGQAVGAYL